jgi:hypothetical protein
VKTNPNPILSLSQIPVSAYLVSGNPPTWEQFPMSFQQELIQVLAALLIDLPEVHPLLEVSHDPEQ